MPWLWVYSTRKARGSNPGSLPCSPVSTWDQGYSAEGYRLSEKGRTWTNMALTPCSLARRTMAL